MLHSIMLNYVAFSCTFFEICYSQTILLWLKTANVYNCVMLYIMYILYTFYYYIRNHTVIYCRLC